MRLEWASFKAVKYACFKWHYSRSVPAGPSIRIGVYEKQRFIGVVIFSRGACQNLGNPYGLHQTEICELSRVALSSHTVPVSRVISVCLKMLKGKASGLRLCVSFADQNAGHHGGIYQAANWVYSGESKSTPKFLTPSGALLHSRQVSNTGFNSEFGVIRRVPKKSECVLIPQFNKYRYLYPLDKEMREQVKTLAKPYPKRPNLGDGCDQHHSGGATPTRTLQDGNV